jgi:hypothetical protein
VARSKDQVLRSKAQDGESIQDTGGVRERFHFSGVLEGPDIVAKNRELAERNEILLRQSID